MSPRLVYLVTEDWYFVSHRLPMARAARAAGFDVHVATHVADHGAKIEAEGFELHPLNWRRGSLSPLHLSGTIFEIRAIYRRLRPDLAHHVALQAALVGSLAATGLPVCCVNAINGFGATFSSRAAKAQALRPLVTLALRTLINRNRSTALVQTDDDRLALERIGIDAGRIALIPGSGVDIEVLKPLPEPSGPVTVAFAGRLLEYKGIQTLVAAQEMLIRRGRDIRLLIAGLPDPAHPGSIGTEQIERWKAQPGIVYLGFVDDISSLWAAAHIAALPSRREGVPKSLLEAAACARPIVATDVPGCRSIARDGFNALLVPPDNAALLADAIDRLAQNPQLRSAFGAAGRKLVEAEFSSERVGHDIVDLYRRLLREPTGLLTPNRNTQSTR